MLETIIFDGEGVVIDTETIWDQGQAAFLGRRGIAYDRSRLKPLLTGRSLMDGTEVLRNEFGLEGKTEDLARERLEIVRERLDRDARFIDGFLEFFERVSGTFQTCVATAMPEDLLAIADRRLGLSELFGGRIFTLSDVGNRSKPNPDLFLFAARQLGSRPDSCVVIEDSPLGLEAARRAGMRSIGLATTFPPERLTNADLVARSYAEIARSDFFLPAIRS